MLAWLFDHLWQSTWVCGCVAALALIARNCFAPLRLWLWRIAALKFAIPFALLFAIGQAVGYPVGHTSIPPPAWLAEIAAVLTRFTSPARAHRWTGLVLAFALLLALACAGACARHVKRRLEIERQLVAEEAARREVDVNAIAPRPGFFRSALLTICALVTFWVPVFGGAVDDRQRHVARLAANSLALRHASLKLSEAPPRMGWTYRVDADAHGVTIRNVNIRNLVALAYGISYFAVYSDQMNSEHDPEANSWLLAPLYDLRVTATIPEPENFDPYALRQAVTSLLAERFGLQLEMNGRCQPPCGIYGMPLADAPP
ncbi:MAG TPA: hypothetical protein VGO61_10120 [Steroidobacteraceae bacterium]|jgi:hypothetical protein|nr:hypothetical protein [Steroidobacteraceae bacterium]